MRRALFIWKCLLFWNSITLSLEQRLWPDKKINDQKKIPAEIKYLMPIFPHNLNTWISFLWLSHLLLTDIEHWHVFLCVRPCRCLVSVQQPVHDEEGGFPLAHGGQHTDQRLPHHGQRPLLLRYHSLLSSSKNSGEFWGFFLFVFFKHKHHLLCFPQRAWWWPRSTQRPVACWPVRSPRRWFRGASWEERPSPRSCFMIPKVFFHVSWLDELTCLGISECQHTSRIFFFFSCVWV